MKKIITHFFWLFMLQTAIAQTGTNAELSAYIKQQADSTFVKRSLPGIAIAMVNEQKTIFYTTGFANVKTKTPFTLNTIFEIGSITKTFTAYVVTKVLQDHHIADTSSILAYLPDSVQTNTVLAGISFKQLLNHSSGLSRIPEDLEMSNNPYDDYTLSKVYHYLKNCSIKPDGKSNYSNTGMGLAGILAARIAKKSYANLIKDYIYQPFKMMLFPQHAKYAKAEGYMGKDAISYWKMDALAPAGGLQLTCGELLSYLQFICKDNKKDKQQQSILHDILTPTISINQQISIAKGWHLVKNGDSPVYWHNGGTFGFSTFCAFNPKNKTALVICINRFSENKFSDALGLDIIKKWMQ